MAPLANNPFTSGRSIQLFRHLECQNPSIISESIDIPNESEKMGNKVRSWNTERNLIHIEEDSLGYECMSDKKEGGYSPMKFLV